MRIQMRMLNDREKGRVVRIIKERQTELGCQAQRNRSDMRSYLEQFLYYCSSINKNLANLKQNLHNYQLYPMKGQGESVRGLFQNTKDSKLICLLDPQERPPLPSGTLYHVSSHQESDKKSKNLTFHQNLILIFFTARCFQNTV